ncbi:ribonuclease E [Moraxella macacae 0408225]|uniref:Ribonuclease G n=1 Tax=Moraxella macacae 0408225 TaxID=1230338 RepID=L2F7C8_9GAMM|nr:Rne/Rng family ribonuclease [Moraxella macacae]ELA08937.1 ribonuclease E [Moraxella macacae 0408225]
MKRILINATHAEEVRVALCNGSHLYDFDLENRTREQKKANIYKGRVTRVEQSLEAVFVEYGSTRQGFLPMREIANEYFLGDPRTTTNLKQLIKEGDELIVQIEKEERGNKGAALSTFISLAGRYLVLMPNNPRGGGISRQISGKLREEMKQAIASLQLPKNMSVILRTAGIGKSTDELQRDLDHLLSIWQNILYQNKNFPSPRLVHQEASVITRAVRDYLRDDIAEIWIDNEHAYNEAAHFIESMMPQQLNKLRKYTDYEPMFSRFGIERQIETAYQREVRLPSGGSIVIDQTEALVSIDINSSKSTKGSDVSETAFNTNLEAADEIARQLRLRDMGGLIVIDFIDMTTDEHQKQVENRLKEATRTDRARLQFAEISRFGLLEMSRQRLRPSLEESTGFLCPRCHGTGMIRDLRSLALSIMRQIEQKALQERHGEIQADVPTDIAAFLLNEKRDSLVYLEQESGTRITILPHAHLDSPEFHIVFNSEGYAPPTYERIAESLEQECTDRGYDTSNWHTEENDTRISRPTDGHAWSNADNANTQTAKKEKTAQPGQNQDQVQPQSQPQNQPQNRSTQAQQISTQQPSAVAWLSNLFAPTVQAQVAHSISSQDAAAAIENIVNTGAKSLGVQGQLAYTTTDAETINQTAHATTQTNPATPSIAQPQSCDNKDENKPKRSQNRRSAKTKTKKRTEGASTEVTDTQNTTNAQNTKAPLDIATDKTNKDGLPKREPNSRRESRGEKQRGETLSLPTSTDSATTNATHKPDDSQNNNQGNNQEKQEKTAQNSTDHGSENHGSENHAPKDVVKETCVLKEKTQKHVQKHDNVQVQIHKTSPVVAPKDVTHISLDNSKGACLPDDTKEEANIENTPKNSVANQKPQTNPTQETSLLAATTIPVATTAPKASLDVTPTQGRAKNDPREVYKAYQQRFNPNIATIAKPIGNLNSITGTVSQFIQQQLNDANEQISQHGTVATFINALHAYRQHANQVQNAQTSLASDDNFSHFFQNYGYEHLSQQNLDDYHQMICPTNQFHASAGKTKAKPAPVTQRASNDPRGSMISIATTQTTEQTKTNKKATKQPDDDTTKSNASHNYALNSAGAWLISQLGDVGKQHIENGEFVLAYLQARKLQAQNANRDVMPNPQATEQNPQNHITNTTDDGFESTMQQSIKRYVKQSDHAKENQQKLATNIAKLENALENALADALTDMEKSLAKIANTINNSPEESSEQSLEQSLEQGDIPKNKTTPASYKNMIESVAEQMQGTALGVLNLAKPKVTRTRKAKVEKTPTKTKSRTSKKVDNVTIVKKPKTDTSDTDPTE